MAFDTEALIRLAYDASSRVKSEAEHWPVWVGLFDALMPCTQSAWRAAMMAVLRRGGHAAGDVRADMGTGRPSRVGTCTTALAILAYETFMRVLAESMQADTHATLRRNPWDALPFNGQYAWVAAVRTVLWRPRHCGQKMTRLSQDHITPLVAGGNHTKSNIVPACRSCNSKKGKGAPLVPVQPLLL